ncbi:MAG: hypothetical protein R3202_05690 [Candidatus Competibacterales bacterium]|nr:hypothetical protein [Candidatus Competibacterales bacterium]
MSQLLLCTALLLGAPLAAAQDFDPQAMEDLANRLFEYMDQDADGEVTEAEYTATDGGGFQVRFDLIDLDGNGAVTRDEYLQAVRHYHQPGGGRMI